MIAYDADLLLEGALQGLGIAYTWNARIPHLIAQGLLVRILEIWSPHAIGLHLYYPDRRYPRPALRAFINALNEHRRRTAVDRVGDAFGRDSFSR